MELVEFVVVGLVLVLGCVASASASAIIALRLRPGHVTTVHAADGSVIVAPLAGAETAEASREGTRELSKAQKQELEALAGKLAQVERALALVDDLVDAARARKLNGDELGQYRQLRDIMHAHIGFARARLALWRNLNDPAARKEVVEVLVEEALAAAEQLRVQKANGDQPGPHHDHDSRNAVKER